MHAQPASPPYVNVYRLAVFELFWIVLIFLKNLREILDIFMFKELIKDKIWIFQDKEDYEEFLAKYLYKYCEQYHVSNIIY